MRPLLLSTVLASTLVFAADFYVSPTGSDSNNGGSGSPFQTLTKAQQAVRTFISGSASQDITVHIADGTYSLTAPLVFTTADSGLNGHTVYWTAVGTGATISGGIKVSGWTQGSNGVYSASVPVGTKSRNLYVGGKASNYARKKITRNDFTYTQTGMTWTNSEYDWLQTTAGIAGAEIRFINSFTDRYAPIKSVGNRQLVMVQDAWTNQLIGYDTVKSPNADFGVWVQNALALISDGGEFYLDSNAGKVYYKPLAGENMATINTYLGVQEVLIAVANTYTSPAHDIAFSGLNFAYTTWMNPSTSGYVDQQTGAYIGADTTYPQFEATRPGWYQMPSAIQISAASNIAFSGGSFTQLGAGGVGIGNDNNAHFTGVGLGAKNVSVTDAYFTQVMGNSITAGGVQAPAHHPPSTNMINSQILISNNIFTNVSSLFSSTVSILATYVQYSTISHNDVYQVPYSGICHGFGWGSNDAGGSSTYQNRGLYNYQPLYTTPTTSQNNLVEFNLLHQYGLSHTDLGALYTLSKSPSTQINENYAYDSSGYGTYTDEGSNSYAILRNVLLSDGTWAAVNGVNTANNTYTDNWYKNGGARSGNTQASTVAQTSALGQRAAYRAGVTPGKRGGRPVTNPTNLADGYLGISCNGGTLTLTLWNFDDLPFTNVVFSATANGASLSPGTVPNGVNGYTWTQATYHVSNGQCPSFTASVQYKNSRTGTNANINGVNATPPSGSPPPGSSGNSSTSTSPPTTRTTMTTSPTSRAATTSPTPRASTTSTPSSSGGGGTAAQYGQCAGLGYTGPTTCTSPFTCTYSNPYYSQCL